MPLTDTQIKNLKPTQKTFKTFDGGGFIIETRKNGSKLWRFTYRFLGKHKLMALGIYPDTTLAKARERHRVAKALLAGGIGPMAKSKIGQDPCEGTNRRWFIPAQKAKMRRDHLKPEYDCHAVNQFEKMLNARLR